MASCAANNDQDSVAVAENRNEAKPADARGAVMAGLAVLGTPRKPSPPKTDASDSRPTHLKTDLSAPAWRETTAEGPPASPKEEVSASTSGGPSSDVTGSISDSGTMGKPSFSVSSVTNTPSMLRNTIVYIGKARNDFEALFALGCDVREFFETEVADRFLSGHFSADANAISPVFAIIASGDAALKYIVEHSEPLRKRKVLLTAVHRYDCAMTPTELAESFDFVAEGIAGNAINQAPLWVADQYKENELRRTGRPINNFTPIDASMGNQQRSSISVVMQPPAGLPSDATFVAEGPLGAIWRCVDPKTNTTAVARELRLTDDHPEWKEIFEAQVKLTHENGKHLTGPYRSTPDAKNPNRVEFLYNYVFNTHFERSFRNEALPVCVILQALPAILVGLKRIHAQGCLARTMSLGTVVFTSDNSIKLLDSYVVPKEHRATNLDWIMKWYCAPESLIDPNTADERSDMWSVGCILVRMLTGRRPLSHVTVDENALAVYLHTQQKERNPLPLNLPPSTPEIMCSLVAKLLSFDPADRPTIDDILNGELLSDTSQAGHPLRRHTICNDDAELDLASHRAEIVPETSDEYREVHDNLSGALLKCAEATDLQLIRVRRINNAVCRERFNMKKMLAGNPGIGFYGAPVANWGSILRYGVLRSGHRLNPQDMTKWHERGTIGSTKRGVYLSKSPAAACKYTQSDPLEEGHICSIILCDCVKGNTQQWPTGHTLTEADYSGPVETFENDTEMYFREESQLVPAYILDVRVLMSGRNPTSRSGKKKYCLFKQCLGRGKFGEVFMALQYPEGRPVAVKKFLHSKPSECRTEFDVLVKLKDYRNIVKVHHYEIKSDKPYMFMELLACSLQDVIDNFGCVPEDQVAKYVRDAAMGLECLRLEGLVHCDIKPANMMLAYDGTLKLADFGLTRARENVSGFAGTLPYMAPELLNGAQHNHSSDVWALGASAVSMLTGKAPFKEIAADHRYGFIYQRTKPDAIRLKVPDGTATDLADLINVCLDDDPAKRPTPLELCRKAGLSSPLMREDRTPGEENDDGEAEDSIQMSKQGTSSFKDLLHGAGRQKSSELMSSFLNTVDNTVGESTLGSPL